MRRYKYILKVKLYYKLSFKRKIMNKVIYRSVDDQERHLALKMSTLKMAHAGRERENTHAKQQGKT
jgi:hypothetical protein